MATSSMSSSRARRHRQAGRLLAYGFLGPLSLGIQIHSGSLLRLPSPEPKTALKKLTLSISACECAPACVRVRVRSRI